MTRFRQLATRSFALLSLVLLLSFSPATIAQQKVEINEKRYDFAQLVNRLSERAGYFPSDNLVSNELSYQHVLGRLEKMDVTGGAYLGVGPDQNFTYIAQIKPRIAFMVNIRRDAMLQHLMFKALFMMSRNRIEYLSNLFARPLPKDHKKWGNRPIRDFIDYFDRTPLEPEAGRQARDRGAEEDRIVRIAAFAARHRNDRRNLSGLLHRLSRSALHDPRPPHGTLLPGLPRPAARKRPRRPPPQLSGDRGRFPGRQNHAGSQPDHPGHRRPLRAAAPSRPIG